MNTSCRENYEAKRADEETGRVFRNGDFLFGESGIWRRMTIKRLYSALPLNSSFFW